MPWQILFHSSWLKPAESAHMRSAQAIREMEPDCRHCGGKAPSSFLFCNANLAINLGGCENCGMQLEGLPKPCLPILPYADVPKAYWCSSCCLQTRTGEFTATCDLPVRNRPADRPTVNICPSMTSCDCIVNSHLAATLPTK